MHKYLLSLLLLVPSLTFAQSSYPYLITGKIGQLDAPAKIYLLHGPRIGDSATFSQGRFELKGTTERPKSAALVVERAGKLQNSASRQAYYYSPDRAFVFLGPDPVVVTSTDSLTHAQITGGPQMAAYQRLDMALNAVTKKMKATHNPAETLALEKEYVQTALAFVRANPDAWASLEELQQLRMIAPPQYAEVAPLYEAFSPALKNSPPGRLYGELLQGLKATATGAQAPNFTQQTPKGKTISLSDYRGKYVLIEFWASWCGPCRQENPAITKAYNAYKGRNFDILGVSLDNAEGRDKWLKAIEEDKLPWPQVSDLRGFGNEAAKRYGVQSIPKNFLVDPAGKIVAVDLHGDELATRLGQLLK